jgi:hypothetical protein
LKNQIVGHVDRLFPGLVISDRGLAKQLNPLFQDLWEQKTPRHLLALCPDPYRLRQHSPQSLYELFQAMGYWMTRPYAAKIIAAVQALCLPDPALVAVRALALRRDLANLDPLEQQVADTEAEMVRYLDYTWGFWLRTTGVDPVRLACLVATAGDMRQYESASQLFGRSGLHSGCNDSGTRQHRGQGRHIVKLGDRHLRRQLLRFTLSMVRRYPALRSYHAQLCQRGLSNTAAYIAVARKLTGIIYVIAIKEVPFDPDRLA